MGETAEQWRVTHQPEAQQAGHDPEQLQVEAQLGHPLVGATTCVVTARQVDREVAGHGRAGVLAAEQAGANPRRGEGSAYLAWDLPYTSGLLARLDPAVLSKMMRLQFSAPWLDYQKTNLFSGAYPVLHRDQG